MKTIQNMIRPSGILTLILLVVVSGFCQSASAVMIGTEACLESDRRQATRDYLQALISREQIREILMAQGINPQEARARIESLTDDEINRIAGRMADQPAGGNIWGFVVIVGAVILIVFLIVEFSSNVKMFPQFHSSD